MQREYLASWTLGEVLKKNGFRVLLTSRHSTSRLLKIFAPNIFISTHVFQLSPEVWENLKKRKTLLYINECEGSINHFGNSTTYPEKYFNQHINYKLFKKIFVWNLYTKKWLEKNRKIKNCSSIGSIRRSNILQIKKAQPKKVVGILGRFEVINTFDERPFIENLFNIQPENKNHFWYFDRCAIDSEVFAITLNFINRAIASGYKIIIRPHPNESEKVYKRIKKAYPVGLVEIDKSISINEWLKKVSVIFGTSSSAFTEPYFEGIPIISTSAIQRFKYIDKNQSLLCRNFDQAAYKPTSIKKAVGLLLRKRLAPKKSKSLKRFFKNFYNIQKKVDPIKKICSDIEKDSKKIMPKSSLFFAALSCYLLILNFLSLLKYIFVYKISCKSDHLIKYNFNSIVHKPSKFMKQIRF